MFNAIMIGGTGATGFQLLNQLIKNKNCNKVTLIGRKSCHLSNDKLVEVLIDSLFYLDSTISYWKGNDVFFNCIGTTRKRAGGAKNFIDIELGISKIAARIASKANISHASIISAEGANHNVWAKNWIHPLLYIKTMGQKEQTIISDFKFDFATIFKPGFLIRKIKRKSILLKYGLPVKTLAKAMMLNAEDIFNRIEKRNIHYVIGNELISNFSSKST